MQAQPTPNAQPQFPIQELEQIESAIQTSQRWIATLQGRRDVLTAELDRLTRPLPAPIGHVYLNRERDQAAGPLKT